MAVIVPERRACAIIIPQRKASWTLILFYLSEIWEWGSFQHLQAIMEHRTNEMAWNNNHICALAELDSAHSKPFLVKEIEDFISSSNPGTNCRSLFTTTYFHPAFPSWSIPIAYRSLQPPISPCMCLLLLFSSKIFTEVACKSEYKYCSYYGILKVLS